ncbi:D-Ala-D-Ala carboxypeptidase family metallohydrolase [Hoeflea halophila]|nr:D-Ala-D-Ala carboxypeptidase family metallohydrolase [Hoeflea halophila]
MFTTQGFAPGSPEMFDGIVSSDESAIMYADAQAAAETAPGVPLPLPSPNASDASARMPDAAAAQIDPAPGQSVVMANTAVDALNRGITQSQPAQSVANLYGTPSAPAPASVALQDSQPAPPAQPMQTETASADTAPVDTDSEVDTPAPQVQELAVVAPPKKKSIFARMFASPKPSAKNAPAGTTKRVVTRDSAPVTAASAGSDALPGVKLASMFDNGSSSSANAEYGQIQLASAAGLARLAPNGLHLQTDKVQVDCFKPRLVRTLKAIERHYGRPVVVTSGYRSPKHNRRIGGASGSRHTSCEAADVQVEGVSKWQLAKYLRSMPGRGGVGTYCHTESVHIDIGNTRDWNWRCRRRK